MAASDCGAGALIFVVSLTATPHTRRSCFTASFHCATMYNKFLAAHWYFIILLSFRFCMFYRDFFESWWLFFLESQYEWSRSSFFCFYPSCFLSVQEVVLCHSRQYPGYYNRGCRSRLYFSRFCPKRIFQFRPFPEIMENVVIL